MWRDRDAHPYPRLSERCVYEVVYFMKLGEFTRIRRPAVAGQFYPGTSEELSATLDKLLSLAGPEGGSVREDAFAKLVRAVVAPHAGYVYSGPTAAKTFARAAGVSYERVLLLAPSHRIPFSGLALSGCDAFATPIGDIPVDADAVGSLSRERGFAIRDDAHDGEHALEVELPFVAGLFPGTPIIPMICGFVDDGILQACADTLLQYWSDDTLWVVSSDFTHYGAAFAYQPFTDNIPEKLKALDMGAVERILNFDQQGFSDYLIETGATICGANPIRLLLETISLAGDAADFTATLVELTNSGELTGEYSHCVGYAGIVFESAVS